MWIQKQFFERRDFLVKFASMAAWVILSNRVVTSHLDILEGSAEPTR